jgi:hypothetical protein
MGDGIGVQYDGIVGKDVFKENSQEGVWKEKLQWERLQRSSTETVKWTGKENTKHCAEV